MPRLRIPGAAAAALLATALAAPAAFAQPAAPAAEAGQQAQEGRRSSRIVGSTVHLVARIGGVDARDPTRVPGHATRTYSGRPRSSMRFRTSAAMATSVAWRPSVCERSASPTTRFQRAMSASTRARQL
jgi:hypothetical protein